jgi:DNA-binding response OmpR family regulator
VLQAHDVAEALELARNSPADLAVLDVMMPKMDGFELTRRLREDDAASEMLIILLTSRSQEADIQRGVDAGADDYILKPFSPQELRSRVREVLGRRRSRTRRRDRPSLRRPPTRRHGRAGHGPASSP